MYRILRKTLKTGVLTEKAPTSSDAALEALGIEVKRLVDKRFNGSLAIREVDAGSCNACELEIHALNNPYYDVERFGIHFVASPRHADILLVTGPVGRHMETALLRTWEATPAPKWVIACGDCACDGGLFGRDNYATRGGVEAVLPVDLYIPGCPPAPVELMMGLLNLFNAAD
ncbi:NADH-quinone oxidoreductase subunit B family protein [Thiolapillus sp.]